MTQFNHIHTCFIATFIHFSWMDDYELRELLGAGYLWK